jgi:hypothetical protein
VIDNHDTKPGQTTAIARPHFVIMAIWPIQRRPFHDQVNLSVDARNPRDHEGFQLHSRRSLQEQETAPVLTAARGLSQFSPGLVAVPAAPVVPLAPSGACAVPLQFSPPAPPLPPSPPRPALPPVPPVPPLPPVADSVPKLLPVMLSDPVA